MFRKQKTEKREVRNKRRLYRESIERLHRKSRRQLHLIAPNEPNKLQTKLTSRR